MLKQLPSNQHRLPSNSGAISFKDLKDKNKNDVFSGENLTELNQKQQHRQHNQLKHHNHHTAQQPHHHDYHHHQQQHKHHSFSRKNVDKVAASGQSVGPILGTPDGDIVTDKGPLNVVFEKNGEKFEFGTVAHKTPSQLIIMESDATFTLPNKTANIRLNNRNVDQRKIQSNTKDIELDAGNNFVPDRKIIIIPTPNPPIQQRSTPVNVYSNDGGNGMSFDDIQEFKGSSTIIRRRHRLGRNNKSVN